MSIIKLTQIYSPVLKLKEADEKDFKERYNNALKSGNDIEIVTAIKAFYERWIPYDRDELMDLLINTDCIEKCVERCGTSELLTTIAHVKFLPRVSEVYLKGQKDKILVLESAFEIQKLIKEASQNNF